MFKVGDMVINLNAIAYVDLEATSNMTRGEETRGVRIYLNLANNDGHPTTLFFRGEQAEYLRKYFTSVPVLSGGVEDA